MDIKKYAFGVLFIFVSTNLCKQVSLNMNFIRSHKWMKAYHPVWKSVSSYPGIGNLMPTWFDLVPCDCVIHCKCVKNKLKAYLMKWRVSVFSPRPQTNLNSSFQIDFFPQHQNLRPVLTDFMWALPSLWPVSHQVYFSKANMFLKNICS